MEVGGNRITRAVTVAHKNDLALETLGAIGANVELTLGRGVARGMGYANGIFPSGLTCRDVPGKSYDAVDNRRDTGGHGVAFGAFDFEGGCAGTSHGGVTIRAENNGADVKLFTCAVNRLVGSDMRQIAFAAAGIAGDRRRPKTTGRLAADDESGGDEEAPDSDGRGGLKHAIEPKEADTLTVRAGFHKRFPQLEKDRRSRLSTWLSREAENRLHER